MVTNTDIAQRVAALRTSQSRRESHSIAPGQTL